MTIKKIPDSELLKKYTASWASGEDDTQMTGLTTVADLPAWESYSKKDDVSQLYVNVKDRYLLYLSGKGNTTAFLKTVVNELKPGQLLQR